MEIGIIVYSGTAGTRRVVDRLALTLVDWGHTVRIEPIAAVGEISRGRFEIVGRPDPRAHQALVFAGPVEAFALSTVTDRYLSTLPHGAMGPAALLVTQRLPFRWMGGNRAARQMARHLGRRGARILGSVVVNPGRHTPEQRLDEAIDRVAALFRPRGAARHRRQAMARACCV